MNEEVQELFSDEFIMDLSPWSVGITFGLRAYPPNVSRKPVVRMRMSLSLAKVLAITLRRIIREYEGRAGIPVELPAEVLSELGIAPEDWT